MELYILDDNFLKVGFIDDFVSVVWTERYVSAGEVSLVLKDTRETEQLLGLGPYLALSGSKEVMTLETVSAESGLVTVTGPSLLKVLNQRIVWAENFGGTYESRSLGGTWTTWVPGYAICVVVDLMCIDPATLGGPLTGPQLALFWADEIIPNLSLGVGEVDASGTAPAGGYDFPVGPVYDSILPVAEQYHVGMSLYLYSADVFGYSLRFKTYQGLDRTRTQSVNEIVRFSPALNSLAGIKRLFSQDGYKNYVYAFQSGFPIESFSTVGPPLGMDRRVMLLPVDSIPAGTPYVDAAFMLVEQAKKALAEHMTVSLLDGEVVSKTDYQYGVHFGLGDIIELEGDDGTIQPARVTEFIRSQDSSGEKAYPTVAIII